MSLAPKSGNTANLGGVSAIADESSVASTMCYKRPGYNAAGEEQQQAPGDGAEYPGEREAKLRRLTPGLEAGGAEYAPASATSAASAQQAGRQYNQQAPGPMDLDITRGVGAGAAAAAAAAAADNPRLKRNKPVKWSAEEDRRLRDAVVRFSEARWKDIASLVETRNHVQCLQRWKKVLKPGLVKGQWSAEEDDRLVGLVEKGFRNWGQVASFMDGRTSKQCRERWCHHLDPAVRKGGYTAEEDELIIFLQGEVGNRWADIAKRLTGRTENAVKIRWKALNRRQRDARNKAAAAASSSGSGVHRPPSRHPAVAGGGYLSPASSLSSSLSDTSGGAGDGVNGRQRMPGGGEGAAHHYHQQQHQQPQQQRPRSVARTSSTSSASSSSSLSSSPPNLSGGGTRAAADAGAPGARSGGMPMRPSVGAAPWTSSTNGGGGGGGPSDDNHPTQPWTRIEDDGQRSFLNPSTFFLAGAGAGAGAGTTAAASRQQAKAVGTDTAHEAGPAASSSRRIERPLEMAAGAAAAGTPPQQGSMEAAAASAPIEADQSTEAGAAAAAERLSPSRAANKMDVAGDGGLHRLCAALRNVEAMDGLDGSKGGGANTNVKAAASAAGGGAACASEQAELKPADAAAGAATWTQSGANQAPSPPPQPRTLQNGDKRAATVEAEGEQSQHQQQQQQQQQKVACPSAKTTAQSQVRV